MASKNVVDKYRSTHTKTYPIKDIVFCKIHPKPGAPKTWCEEVKRRQREQPGGGVCKGCGELLRGA